MLYVKNGRKYFSKDDASKLAMKAGYGQIRFEEKSCFSYGGRPTSTHFEVGYIWIQGEKHLFCRNQPHDEPDTYYLCNEFVKLTEKKDEKDNQLSLPFY